VFTVCAPAAMALGTIAATTAAATRTSLASFTLPPSRMDVGGSAEQ
jgi:hypothetical protein